MGDKKVTIEGWAVDPGEIRRIADKMDIPLDLPLPPVVVVSKGEESKHKEGLSGGPHLHESSSPDSKSGYFVTLRERDLAKVGEETYVLGPEARDDIRHELAHYLEHLELGTLTGRVADPYDEAVREIKAELRARTRYLPLSLARLVVGLAEDYGLSGSEALTTVVRAARSLAVSGQAIGRAKRLYAERCK